MKRRIAAATALCCLAGLCGAGDWELKLEVKELWGKPGLRRVTGGIPLLAGQARETSELRLCVKDEAGKLVPVSAQFRVLARWWRQDNSIRWVLSDFATDLQADEAKTFYLVGSAKPASAPAAKLAVRQTDDLIEVTTGPARFVVNRKKFAFLDKAFVDADGDGHFAESENLLDGSPDMGTVVEDTYGEKYYGSESANSVDVLESGPMRVCVRARGLHDARGDKGYSKGMYSYDCFLNFYADSSDVYADVVVGNHPPKSSGSPTFEDASLFLKLAGAEPEFRVQGEQAAEGGLGAARDIRESKYWYSLQGEQVTEGRLAEGESVCLYQDSNGAETWESCQGYDDNGDKQGWTFPKGVTSSFRGYRVLRRAPAGEQILTNGDHARGLVRLNTERGGVVVHTKDFWQQFPKAVEVFGDGRVRIGLFPSEYKVPHFLEDSTAKGHELVLHFYAPGLAGPYPADSAGRPDPASVADCWDSRVYPRPPIEHMAACGALADVGPFTVPVSGLNHVPDTRNSIDSRRMLTADVFYGNAYGWQIFGERWRSQGGAGAHGARQPMDEDDYLRRWYWTGVRDWLAVGLARSRHFRDVRGYRIEGQDPFGFENWTEYRASNMSERRADRPQPDDEEYLKYTKGIWRSGPYNEETPPPGNRLVFWHPNPEHNVLDLLYDRYLLLGDIRAFENMKYVAATAFYHTAYHEPIVHRSSGWCWRTMVRYWELTGDAATGHALRKLAAHYAEMIGKPPLVCGREGGGTNWWFTGIFCRGVALAALHTGDPTALELAKTCAIGKEDMEKARRVMTLFAVLYHLTGDEKYKKAVDRPENDEKNLTAGGNLFACDHWLLHQPPRAKPE